MNKKKTILSLINGIVIILLIILSFTIDNNPKEKKTFIPPEEIIDTPTPIKDGVNIKLLQDTYQNTDIIGYLSIPDVLNYPIVQANDNEYYLRRLLDGSTAMRGTPFMDYRTTFEDKKILIYGHSGEEENFPFLPLHNYENESYYQEHPTIYLYSINKKYTYQIISSYLETEDYDYVNINSFRGLTWKEHVEKLKGKSEYPIESTITDDSKVLVLQTCNIENLTLTGRYRLVIGLLTNIEDNIYE